jgi:hypothetical protein
LHVREEEDIQCRSKRHRFGFFLWTVYETASFWTKRAVSFKRKWRQNMLISKLILNFLIYSL